jgi:MSHA pilin protein MshD
MCTNASRGVTLVELVVFIVVIGVGMAGLFAVFNTVTKGSADPEVRKQAIAIAESLMDEVALMPFTYCDPNDANASTAASSAGCAVAPGNSEDFLPLGPKGAESRGSVANPLVNVSGYNTYSTTGIKDITNTSILGLGGYSAAITVAQTTLGPGTDSNAFDTIAITSNPPYSVAPALRISIQVTHLASGVSFTLEGYRTRYAPNTAP